MNTFSFDLDLAKSVSPEVVVLRQGDKSGTALSVTLYDHGTRLTTSGLSASVVIDLPDNTHYYRADASYSNGIVTHTIDEEYAASAPGRTNNAYVVLKQGDSVIASSASFSVLVLRSATDGKTEGKDYDDEITRTIRTWLDEHPEATTTVTDDSLTTPKYKDKSVTEAKLADSSVTTDKLAGSSVTTAKLDNLAVTEAKLADGSVTTKKLADGAVTADKIADGLFSVVTDTQIAAMLD